MRAAVVVAAVIGLGLGVARADAPRGFDHQLHARDVAVSGGADIACVRCHAQRAGVLLARPGHAACFGACHGPPPRAASDPARASVCAACHAPGARTVERPAYRRDPDHALAIGHLDHAAIACAQCHTAPRAARGTPAPPAAVHRRCLGCHDGSGAAGRGPAMTACAGCHVAASGRPAPPALRMDRDVEIVVTSAFSHARHASRSPAGRACTTCHAAVRATNDAQLPRPTADGCAAPGCHDARAAFPITAACTRCHQDAPARKFEVERPDARFSHAAHAALLPFVACASCHPLAASGEVAVAGHAACAGCHAEDFGIRRPRTCGACHNATEPWRALQADRLPPARSEFGAALDHAVHPGACASCHRLATEIAELRPPRGHRACTGAGCHAVSSGAAPALTACEGCHARGREAARLAERLAAPWSVRARFRHAPHAQTACATCHVDGATTAPPAKAQCAPCHDGRTAFKLTGTHCARCHTGAAAAQ